MCENLHSSPSGNVQYFRIIESLNIMNRYEMLLRELQKNKQKQKCSLLNDTKWKEIIRILIEHADGNFVYLYYTDDNQKLRSGFIPAKNYIALNDDYLSDRYIRDPAFGKGPTHYNEIVSLFLPFSNYETEVDNPRIRRNITNEEGEVLFNKLQKLGEVPIEINEEHIAIYGYSN